MRDKLAKLYTDYNYGRNYITMVSFMMISTIFIDYFKLPNWAYLLIVPVLLMFVLGAGELHRIFLLKKEVLFRNPILKEIYEKIINNGVQKKRHYTSRVPGWRSQPNKYA